MKVELWKDYHYEAQPEKTLKLKVKVEEIGEQQPVLLEEVNLVLNKDCAWVSLEGGGLLGGVLEMVDVVVIVVVEILTRRLKLKPRIIHHAVLIKSIRSSRI